jgi:nicotinamidase-related amidase
MMQPIYLAGRRAAGFALLGRVTSATLAVATLCAWLVVPAMSQTIVDEWSTVKPPPPPELQKVTIDPKTTALLVLDIVKQTCNMERRPRCVASVPKIQSLLDQARLKGVAVIHSITTAATPADIAKEVAPREGEPIVQSGADKFFKTDLDKILTQKGVKTVIVVGTAAHGAVLYTASGAALRGLQVIVPVDGSTAESTYIEQYTLVHLLNSPATVKRVTLTRTDMVQF